MKNIFLLILGKSEKRGGGEKPSDVKKPGVLYLLCSVFSPPCCLPVEGTEHTLCSEVPHAVKSPMQ